jgi:hypothetical protein
MNEGKKFCADCSQSAVFEDTSWMATRGISRDRTPLSSLGPHASLSSQHCSIVLLSSRRSAPRLCYRRQLMMDARAAHVSSTRSDGASSAPPRSPLLLAPPRLAMPSSTSVSLFLHRNLCCHLSMMKPLDKRTTVAAERRDGTSCGRILFLLIPIMFARHQIVSTSYSHDQFHCCNPFMRMAFCQLLHKTPS